MTARIHKIYGPPGTGKTYTIIRRLAKLIAKEHIPRDQIMAVSYTKAAIRELRSRLRKDEILPAEQIRSWHSLLWSAYGLGRRFWKTSEKVQFFRLHGYDYDPGYLRDIDDDETPSMRSDAPAGNQIESAWSAALMISTPESWRVTGMLGALLEARRKGLIHEDVDISAAEDMWHRYINKSNEIRRYDYLMAPYLYLTHPESALMHGLRLLIIDEAQDLSPLMWDWERRMAQVVDEIWLVGDDDQAILEFLGADATLLQDAEAHHEEVLNRTWRYGIDLVQLALSWISQDDSRKAKDYTPADLNKKTQVKVSPGSDPVMEAIGAQEYGSVLLLARHRSQVRNFSRRLKQLRIRHALLNSSTKIEGLLGDAIVALLDGSVSDDIVIPLRAQESLFDIYGVSLTGALTKKDIFEQYPELILKLRKDQQRKWKTLSNAGRESLAKNLQKHFYTWPARSSKMEPKIRLGTIHSSKGMEADTVVLYMDATAKVVESLSNLRPAELRVWYVGITRARNRLILTGTDKTGVTNIVRR